MFIPRGETLPETVRQKIFGRKAMTALQEGLEALDSITQSHFRECSCGFCNALEDAAQAVLSLTVECG